MNNLIFVLPTLVLQFRMEPGQVMEESYTVEEEPQELPPVVSVETSEDGTTRRTETTVAKRDKKKKKMAEHVLEKMTN